MGKAVFDANKLYITDVKNDYLYIFDMKKDKVVDTIKVGEGPRFIASSRNKLVVTSGGFGYGEAPTGYTVITRNKVKYYKTKLLIERIKEPSRGRYFVTLGGEQGLIDTNSNQFFSLKNLIRHPRIKNESKLIYHFVDFLPLSKRYDLLAFTYEGAEENEPFLSRIGNKIDFYSQNNMKLTQTLKIDSQPSFISDINSKITYIGLGMSLRNKPDNRIAILDKISFKVIDYIKTLNEPSEILAKEGSKAYLIYSSDKSTKLTIIDTNKSEVRKTVDYANGRKLEEQVIELRNSKLYVLHYDLENETNKLLIYDIKKFRKITEINIGDKISDFDIYKNKIYFTGPLTGKLYIYYIDSKTIKSLKLGKSLYGLATYSRSTYPGN